MKIPLLKAMSTLTAPVMSLIVIVTTLPGVMSPAMAQDGNRWYQIEVTIFAHENSNVLQEQWPDAELALAYPDNTRQLDSLLDHLTLDDWTVMQPPATPTISDTEVDTPTDDGPAGLRSSDYRLPDPLRDAFVALPASDHDFTQTNRALTQSAAYRVLYHNAWRQPVMHADGATPLAVPGGRQFGEQHELEGTLTIRFNQSRDRVLLDTNLWLSRFSAQGADPTQFIVTDVFPMRDSRAMRSNEFHYLDHPAIGVLVQVFPYEPPAAAITPFSGTDLPL